MKCNVGGADRFIRVILGIAGIVFGVIYLPAWWAIVMLAVGVILGLTAATRFCPLWVLFHINTCKTKS